MLDSSNLTFLLRLVGLGWGLTSLICLLGFLVRTLLVFLLGLIFLGLLETPFLLFLLTFFLQDLPAFLQLIRRQRLVP